MASLKCGYCGSKASSSVVDSRTDAAGFAVRRRRLCANCGKKYSTYEVSRENLKDMAIQILDLNVEPEVHNVRRKSVEPDKEIYRETINDFSPDEGIEQDSTEVEDFAEEFGVL